jgi:hypothetical protein
VLDDLEEPEGAGKQNESHGDGDLDDAEPRSGNLAFFLPDDSHVEYS